MRERSKESYKPSSADWLKPELSKVFSVLKRIFEKCGIQQSRVAESLKDNVLTEPVLAIKEDSNKQDYGISFLRPNHQGVSENV